MAKYMLLTKTGTYPPKYEHETIESAVAEAKRLNAVCRTSVKILKVVGEVKTVQVPVTRDEVICELSEPCDELPF